MEPNQVQPQETNKFLVPVAIILAGIIHIHAQQKEPPKTFTNNMGMTFVWIPPGNFVMGSPKEEGYIDPSDQRYLKSNDHSHRIQNPLDQYYVDVISRMYPALYTAPLLANQPNGDHRPIFFCEYAHAMGNSVGNIKEF